MTFQDTHVQPLHPETDSMPPVPAALDPGLYIVATPIGNLGDLSPRAAAILAGVKLIAAEDSRVTAKLLRHIGAKVPMLAYHDHSDDSVRRGIIARALHEPVALVSDAGTPLISDPGFKLVRDARSAGVVIVTIPGPCAAIAALTRKSPPFRSSRHRGGLSLPPGCGARGCTAFTVF